MTFQISHLVLASDLDLPELTPVTADADWTFSLTSDRLSIRPPAWFQRWRGPRGRRHASFALSPSGYLLRFHGVADFAIDMAGRSIVCHKRHRRTTATTVRHLLLDQVMPLVVAEDTRLVLHAAAVVTPRGVVGFAGRTGAGKSTLAVALAAAGFPLLCDDCLVVEPAGDTFAARMFYPGARLWPDSVRAVGASDAPKRRVAQNSRKQRVGAAAPSRNAPVPMTALVILDRPRRYRRSDAVTLTRLRGRQSLLPVLEYTRQLDLLDALAVRRRFELQSRVVASMSVYRLAYPWNLKRLAETRDEVVRMLMQ